MSLPRAFAFALALLCAASGLAATDPGVTRFAEVDAAPVKTWIYLGSVTLTASPFIHRPGEYTARYSAKVFPYFFYDESGRMVINVSDQALRRIAAGQPIAFSGRAIRTDGAVRTLEGRAMPTGPGGGKLQVKLHVGGRLTLVFNTTYRLPEAGALTASETR